MAKAKKFRLGPKQRARLKMLETTRRKQTIGALHDSYGYCCLGIGELALGKSPKEIEGRYLPKLSYRALGLRSNEGHPDDIVAHQMLTALNDDEGWSFKQIAAHLRKYAAVYFKRSA